MTAADILSALIAGNPCPTWISQAATLVDPPRGRLGAQANPYRYYETTAVTFFPEVTVRLKQAKGSTRRGLPRLQRRRMDLVGLVQPHYKNYKPFVIGVEVKVDYHDLVNDLKLADYLAYCHLFYLAVPAGLELAARQKLDSHARLARSGVIVVHEKMSTRVAFLPVPHEPSAANLAELYAELLIRPFKVAGKTCKTFVNFERKADYERSCADARKRTR